MKRMHEVLMDLCSTIDAAGGLVRDDAGHFVPAGDKDWLDLACVYLDACEVLGREPLIEQEDDEVDDTPVPERKGQ